MSIKWDVAEHDGAFVLSGEDLGTENEVMDKLGEVLGRNVDYHDKDILKCAWHGRFYYGIFPSSLDDKYNVKLIMEEFVDAHSSDGLYADKDISTDVIGLSKLVKLIDFKTLHRWKVMKSIIAFMIACIPASMIGYMISISSKLESWSDWGTIGAMVLFIVLTGVAIWTVLNFCVHCVEASDYNKRHRPGLIDNLRIKECYSKDKVLYIINPYSLKIDEEDMRHLVKIINKTIKKSSLNKYKIKAGLFSGTYHDNMLYLIRDYAPGEQIPDVQYTYNEVLSTPDVFDKCFLYNLDDYVENQFPKSKMFAKALSSNNRVFNSIDNADDAEKLCGKIRVLETECLNSTKISDNIDSKLDALRTLDDPDNIYTFITQLEKIEKALESLKNSDSNIDDAMTDISDVIKIKSQLGSKL